MVGTTTPTFTLSFDTELIWGSFREQSPTEFERRHRDVRGTIESILRLLETHEISATWAVVGHLFLSECSRDEAGRAHAEIVRPPENSGQADWFSADPCTDVRRDPLCYGRDILDLLQAATVEQEIACHSFAHAQYGASGMTREAVDSDLEACIALADEHGIELKSFVFPADSMGYHEALSSHGFRAYRGSEPKTMVLPQPIMRAARFCSYALGLAPTVSVPEETLPGLWNIPTSAVLTHRSGVRKLFSRRARLRRGHAGLHRAIAEGGVFHLWAHPFDLADGSPYLVDILGSVLDEATRLRDRGLIVIEPMATVAERFSRRESE